MHVYHRNARTTKQAPRRQHRNGNRFSPLRQPHAQQNNLLRLISIYPNFSPRRVLCKPMRKKTKQVLRTGSRDGAGRVLQAPEESLMAAHGKARGGRTALDELGGIGVAVVVHLPFGDVEAGVVFVAVVRFDRRRGRGRR